MSGLISIYFKKDKLEEMLQNMSDGKGVQINVSVNDDSNQYGQNVTAFLAQTKEERTSGKAKQYFGNGKVFWTDGKMTIATTDEQPQQQKKQNNDSNVFGNDDDDDLPF